MITLSLPRRIRKAAAHPYPDLPDAGLSVTEAIAALPADEGPRRPAPTFTPAPLRATTPLQAFAEAQRAWTAPPEFTAHPDALRAAVRALRGGAPRGEHPYPEAPAPVPAFTPRHRGRPSPGAVLRADRDELPVFRGTARSLGWRAVLPAPAAGGWVRYGTDRWMQKAMRAIDAQVTLARRELTASAAEFAAVESRRAAAADAAIFPVRHQ